MTNQKPRPDAPNDQTSSRAGQRRRTLLTSAAWAVPATVVVNAAPAFAASCPNPTTVTHPAPVPSGNGPESETSTFIVPDGVTEITYRVVGGQGGRRNPAFLGAGGAEVVGQLAVTPGTELTLLVGQGGTQHAWTDVNLPAGGQGYGNGGQPGSRPALTLVATGGSGGGGSAILLEGAPIIVAGGGGGAGLSMAPSTQSSIHQNTAAGPGGQDALNARITWDVASNGNVDPTDPYAEAAGGHAASGATGGSGGQQGETALPAPGRTLQIDSGGNGTNFDQSVGGHGGTGGGGTIEQASSGSSSGGGGGGGYAGGGGGGSIAVRYNARTGTAPHPVGGFTVSAGGGGGSNFVSPVPVGSVTPLGEPEVDTIDVEIVPVGERRPGLIELTYDICL